MNGLKLFARCDIRNRNGLRCCKGPVDAVQWDRNRLRTLLVIVEESNIHPMCRGPDENSCRLVSGITLNRTKYFAFASHIKPFAIVIDGVREFPSLRIVRQSAAVKYHAAADDR